MNYKSRHFVDLHVIDAIDEASFNKGYSDAAILRKALKDTSINIVAYIARDTQSLKATISEITNYRRSYVDPRTAIPYIHISCHGTRDDLTVGEADTMPWSVLSEALLPLQEKTDYNIPLSLSSCWGYHGAKLAYVRDAKYRKRRPYYSLVGPPQKEGILALGNAFGRFYRYLLTDFKDIRSAVALANKEGSAKLDYTYGSCVAYCPPKNPPSRSTDGRSGSA